MYVYILHFRTPLATGRAHSRHYIGSARNWIYRVQCHRRGTSRVRLINELHRRGIADGITTACVLTHLDIRQREADGSTSTIRLAGRHLERYLKRQHNHQRYCPLCGSTRVTDYRLETAHDDL